MATSEVTLLGSLRSPFVNRVAAALKIKSIEYELIEVNPYDKTELLLKSNPVHKKVPVLIHAGKPICESLVIVQYIDDAWPNGHSILPTDPHDRAVARFWAAYIDDKWSPLFKQLKDAKDDEELKASTMEKIGEGLVLLEEAFVNCSKGKDFFGGDNVGYLDIVLGGHVGWLKVTEILTGTKVFDEIKTPKLSEWAEKLYSESSSIKDVVLEPQALLEVFKKMQAMSTASS